MNPPYPDRNDWKRRSLSRKLKVCFAVGGLVALTGLHKAGKSEANLADGTLRQSEYRAFFRTRSDETETELSRLARAAGYQPPPDVWVNCKSYRAYGPYEERGNGWDMEAHSVIIHAGAVASFAKDLGQPKSLQWYQVVFERLQRREYRKLALELDEGGPALISKE
jgi:hypothetical protein